MTKGHQATPTMDGHIRPRRTVATVIDLEAPESWPDNLLAYLQQHHDLFLEWETGHAKVTAVSAYERTVCGLCDILRQYAITGWHCTRLTEAEMADIQTGGMQLLDAAMLIRRIDALLANGLMTEAIAACLKGENQAHESNRAGMVSFCFFPPRRGGESGIRRFFRYWGGEALYNSHERNPKTAAVISSIGVPCLIEADVPIASLKPSGGLDDKIVRRFLISRGHQTREPIDHQDRITHPLPPENVRRIIRFPEPDFQSLTGCEDWREPLSVTIRR